MAVVFSPEVVAVRHRGRRRGVRREQQPVRTALLDGVEWNLRVDRHERPDEFAEVARAYDELWERGVRLDAEWVAAYAQRVDEHPRPLPPGEQEAEALEPPPEPRVYREMREGRGARPTIRELYGLGYDPRTLRGRYGGWFGFVEAEGDLRLGRAAWERARAWFEELERTSMTKAFKMVVLRALLDADALDDGMRLEEFARRCHALIVRSPELLADILGVRRLPDPRQPNADV